MNKLLLPIALAALAGAGAVRAHVSIDEPRGPVGGRYEGVVRVGHGCDGSGTTSLTLQLPQGVRNVSGQARGGWSVRTTPTEVTWKAPDGAPLASGEKGEFPIAMTLPRIPGPLWFKALQVCEKGSADWVDVPSQGTSTAGMKTPALLVQVMSAQELAAARVAPKIEGAWARASVPGQQSSGAFMRITAKERMELVGVSTPAAGVADVHEMKMEGDVMRMRPVAKLELPAGKPVDLGPGGYHIMLQQLKSPLVAGSTIPLTLVVRDAKGQERRVDLQVPVAAQPPAGAAAPMAGMDMPKH